VLPARSIFLLTLWGSTSCLRARGRCPFGATACASSA
jgi:hypothetical protein